MESAPVICFSHAAGEQAFSTSRCGRRGASFAATSSRPDFSTARQDSRWRKRARGKAWSSTLASGTYPREGNEMPIAPELKDILACPKCNGELEFREDAHKIISRACKVVYRIEDDIPVMLVDEPKPLQT